jgi:type IV pilus assembly protein PilF
VKGQSLRLHFVLYALTALLAGCASSQTVDAQGELRTLSDQTDLQKRANIRLQLAIGYFERGQTPVALDEIKQALQINSDFGDAYSLRALIYMNMGENKLAEDNFVRAVKLLPNDPDLANNYGWFLCQSGREKQSIPYFDAALKNRSYQSPAKALHNAGVCSAKLKENQAAENYFLQAFKLDPGNLSTSAHLGKIYYERADYARARFYVGRASKAENVGPDVLWLAIKTEHKLGDRVAEAGLVTQLRRRHPDSPEYAAYQRGAFDE